MTDLSSTKLILMLFTCETEQVLKSVLREYNTTSMGNVKHRVIWKRLNSFNSPIGIFHDYKSKGISIVSIDDTTDDVIRYDGFDQDDDSVFDDIGFSVIIFMFYYYVFFLLSTSTDTPCKWKCFLSPDY